MIRILYNLKNTLSYLILFALFNSCNGQSKEVEICQVSYKNAKLKLGKYGQDSDKFLIKEAMKHIDTAINCKETRKKSIELKISLLSILKEYKNAYEFIDSLSEDDFLKKYKKTMQYNFFRALEDESKGDISGRNKYFLEIIKEIESNIKSEYATQKMIDEEAYYDLFFIKSKLLSKQEMKAEIGSLKKQYSDKEDFFDILKESFNEETKESYPIPSD
jgi:hypothetical protein